MSQITTRLRRHGLAGHLGITVVINVIECGLTFSSIAAVLRVVGATEGGKFSLMLKIASVAALFSTLGVQAAAVLLVSGALADGNEPRADAMLHVFLRL